MKLCALFIVLALAGCSTRENAKAQKQADQALEATQRLLRDLEPQYNTLNEEDAQLFLQTINKVYTLVTSARESIAPGLRLLSKGEEIHVDTTVEEAITSTDSFRYKAMRQSARAEVETDTQLTLHTAMQWAYSNASELLLTGGVGGLLLTLVTLGAKWYADNKQHRKVEESLARGSVLLQSTPPEHQESVKKTLESEQKAANIHDLVKARLKNAKKT